MAANNQIVKKSIQIDAGDTLRTVKSLKQEISDLRDELLNLEKGTEEYDEVQKQLQDDVNDLNEVMGAHKEKAQALEGSYNDLQNKLKELKTAWKETNDEAERDVLGQKINELNTQLKEMDASIGDFHRNVGNYESAWNGLTGVMENGEKITDDLEKGIKAFGTALGMSDKQVNALSKSLKSLKDGFKIAKDIAKAKEETGKLATEETKAAAGGTALAASQKATGAAAKTMAVSETAAAGATKGLSVAMRGLKAALISTGIGALIVALGTLIGQLDEARLKLRLGKKERDGIPYDTEEAVEKIKESREKIDKEFERELKILEAQGATEDQILQKRKEHIEEYADETQVILDNLNNAYEGTMKREEDFANFIEKFGSDVGMALGGPIFKWLLGKGAKVGNEVLSGYDPEKVENQKKAISGYTEMLEEYGEQLKDINTDIEVFKFKQKQGTDALTSWADAIKDPNFQRAWTNLFTMDFGGSNPTEILKNQKNAALALLKEMKVDSKEVEALFDNLIDDSEEVFRSIQAMEEKIYEEGLTPVQKLEKERDEWVKIYTKWGQDTYNVVKYYNDKIQEELAKTTEETVETTEEYLARIDAALDTQAKMDKLFNPMFITDTARGDIDQEMEAIQRLYDTQMEYLNNLLESADLTEEAYAGVEDRIRELTVEFNNQMASLNAEAEYQGKNWAILSRKGVANFQLLEDAAANFSSVFQSLGLENSVAYKGFASAQAIISAILAANRVLAEEPGGAVIKGIAAAATLAAGLANVAAIWMVNPDGSNAGSAMNTSMEQPAVPVIGNAQPINYVSNVTNAAEEDELNKYNLYVRVTDIDEGLEGQRVRVENSSF